MENKNTLKKSAETAVWQEHFKLKHFLDTHIFSFIILLW